MSLDTGDALAVQRLSATTVRPYPSNATFGYEKESWSC